MSILVTTGVYALVVAATTRGLGPADAVPAGWVWTAAALALVATTAGICGPDPPGMPGGSPSHRGGRDTGFAAPASDSG